MFCPYCGRENIDGTVFCAGCGNTLANNLPVDPSENVTISLEPTEMESTEMEPMVIEEPVESENQEAPESVSQPAKKPKSKKGCIVAAIIALLAILGLLGVLLVVIVLVLCLVLIPVFNNRTEIRDNKWLNTEVTEPYAWNTMPTEEAYTEPVEAETEETTDGNPYRAYLSKYAQYVLPNSDSAYLGRADICDLTPEEREIATQEIYARHGVPAEDMQLQAYFEARSWFRASAGTPELNEYEEANLMLLRVFQAQEDGTLYYSDNPFPKLQHEPDRYMIPNSNSRFLNSEDLQHLTLEQLQIARNEIYARHGYIFGYDEMAEYFYTKNWYYPSVLHDDFDDKVFTEYEKLNLDIILAYEKRAKGVSFSSSNPFKNYYNPNRDYIFPQSSYSYIYESDLYDLDWQEYSLGRYEILARHGYTFKDTELLEYFLQYSWYIPDTPAGKIEYLDLNVYEEENYELLGEEVEIAKKIPNLSNLDTSLTYELSTSKFSLTVPAYWKNYAIVQQSGDSISFYEKYSYDTYGGKLFSIHAYYSPADYSYLPNYRVCDNFVDADGRTVYVVMVLPTDVQARPSAMRLYSKMENEISRIASTVQPINEREFDFIG